MKTNKNALLVIISTLVLVVVGIVFVYSASWYSATINYGNKYHFLIKQIIGAVVGLAGLVFFWLFDYKKLRKFSVFAIIVGFVLLVLVFIPGIGVSNYGAKRWIGLPGFTIQASEVAKFCFILFCASYLAKNHEKIGKFSKVLPVLFVGIAMCLLVLLEPSMSVTICIALTMVIMLFVGGMKLSQMAGLGLCGVCAVPMLIIAEPYRMKRLVAFIDPWTNPKGEGFQLIQSLYGLGNGGLFGVGLFQSRQKYLFLPFSESDFIFSIIGEETGFVGCVLLMCVFMVLIVNGIQIAKNAQDRFGCYLATGIISITLVQVLINIAVVTGSIPPTGIPLPFISAGSSSLVMFLSAIGILLNIEKQSRKNPFKVFSKKFT